MERLFIIVLISLLITSYDAKSQINTSVDNWMDYVESMAGDTDDQERIETLFAELSYLAEHPFDINKVTAEELGRLSFLSDQQIDEIVSYREKYGLFVSLYELKQLVSLDFSSIGLLLPFVYVEEAKAPSYNGKRMRTYGKNELYLRYDRSFQQKKGYGEYSDSLLNVNPNKKYLGEPFAHSLRYSYSKGSNIQLGIVGEKDAGESFLSGKKKGYDYYSAHLIIKEMGVLKCLALGDYKVSFGQGLVISNDFSPSRSSMVLQTKRRNNGFRRHFLTNETDFFRGIGSTVTLGKLDMSLFYSFRKLDATADSLLITSFKTDGLHRIQRELDKKGVVSTHTGGGNIRYASPLLSAGFTVIGYSFGNRRVEPEFKPYTAHAFRGSFNMNMSLDYELKFRKMTLYGETAFSRNGALATLNCLQVTPASFISWLITHRYYDRRYHAFYGNAFGQNSNVQNEQGVYIGMQLFPASDWKLSMYADLFSSPWLKYGMNTPSSGKEYMAEATYTPRNAWSVSFRYQHKEKEAESVSKQHRMRLQAIVSPSETISLRTTLNGILSDPLNKRSYGWMVSQSAGYKPASLPIQMDGYFSYFDTDDYATRITSYEKNLLYAFSMPSFYGQGIRCAFSFKASVLDNLYLSAKLGWVHYFDRNEIGTDMELIEGSDKTDLNVLVGWKF